MKTFVKATAASAAALLAATSYAAAQEQPTMSVGGFIDSKFTVNSQDDAFEEQNGKRINFDPRQDGEIHFNGSVKLDNGITIRTRVELEAFTVNDGEDDLANFSNGPLVAGAGGQSGGDLIDESWMNIGGSFGNFRIGSTDTASKRMTTGHQGTFRGNVGENTRFNIQSVVKKPGTVANSGVSQVDLQSDGESVSYVTPRFAGFVVGVDYTPTSFEDSAQLHRKQRSSTTDIFGGAVNWVGKFGDVTLSLNGGYQTGKSETPGNSDPEQYALGAHVTIGGLFAVVSWQHNDNSAAAGSSSEEDIYEAGIRYSMGPNAFSIVGAWSEMGGNIAAIQDDESQVYSIAYARTLGPGVKWHTTLHIADWEDGLPGAPAGNSNDGYGVTTGMLVRF